VKRSERGLQLTTPRQVTMRVPRGDILYYVTLTITRDGSTRYTTILLGTKTNEPQSPFTPTSTPPQETTTAGESSSGSSGGRDTAVTALIVVGVLLGVVLILALLWWCCIAPFRKPPDWRSTTTNTSSRPSTPGNDPDVVTPPRRPSPVRVTTNGKVRKGKIYRRYDQTPRPPGASM